ncbi:MAG: hypothetical protein AAGD35_20935 [Actinomycetota bacterium]
MTVERHLIELGQGVFAFAHPEPRFGNANVGLVIDADGLTVVDTTANPGEGAAVLAAIHDLTAELGLPLKRVVLTSSRIPFSGGSQPFWQAAFYGTDVTSEQLDTVPNLDAFRRLLPEHAAWYHDEFATRPITHTVEEPTWLTGAAYGVPVEGEAGANLVVQVEGANVVFAGAIASFRVTPLAFDGNPVAWIESLDRLAAMADTVVPGHGPVGGAADLKDLAGYLTACVEADGDPSAIPAGPWDAWSDRHFDTVNVERAARLAVGDPSIPQSMFELLGLM